MAAGVNDVKRIVDMVLHNRIVDAVKEILIYGVIAWVMFITTNPDFVNKKLQGASEREHAALVEKRLSADPKVRALLQEAIYELGCDRSYVCEFHNGTNNFSGLPFLYLDMKYEVVADDSTLHIDDEYINFNLTRYEFVPYALKCGYWCGSVSDLELHDTRFAANIRRDGGEYVAFVVINGVDNVIGVLGITYHSIDGRKATDREIQAKLYEISQKLGILLSA